MTTKRCGIRYLIEFVFFASILASSLYLIIHVDILSNYQDQDFNGFLQSYPQRHYALDLDVVSADEKCSDRAIYPSNMANLDLLFPNDGDTYYKTLHATAWKNSKMCLRTDSRKPIYRPRNVPCPDTHFRCQDYCFRSYSYDRVDMCPITNISIERIDESKFDKDNKKQFQYGDQSFEIVLTRVQINDINYPEKPLPFVVSLGVNSQEDIQENTTTTSPTQNGICLPRRPNGARKNDFPNSEKISRECSSYDNQYSLIDSYPDIYSYADALPLYPDVPHDLRYSEAYFVIENHRLSEDRSFLLPLQMFVIRETTSQIMVPKLYQSFEIPLDVSRCYEAGITDLEETIALFFNADDTGLKHMFIFLIFYCEMCFLIACFALYMTGYIINCCQRLPSNQDHHQYSYNVSQSDVGRDFENENENYTYRNNNNIDQISSYQRHHQQQQFQQLHQQDDATSIVYKDTNAIKFNAFHVTRFILLSQIPTLLNLYALFSIFNQVHPLTQAATMLQYSGCVLGEFQEILEKLEFQQRFQQFEQQIWISVCIKIALTLLGIIFYASPCIFSRGEVCYCAASRSRRNDSNSSNDNNNNNDSLTTKYIPYISRSDTVNY